MTNDQCLVITGDSITDEQIRELRRTQSPITGNCAWLCSIALGEQPDWCSCSRDEARARCAEILNNRNGVDRTHARVR